MAILFLNPCHCNQSSKKPNQETNLWQKISIIIISIKLVFNIEGEGFMACKPPPEVIYLFTSFTYFTYSSLYNIIYTCIYFSTLKTTDSIISHLINWYQFILGLQQTHPVQFSSYTAIFDILTDYSFNW